MRMRSELPGIVAGATVLVFRLGWLYVRLQFRVKRASRQFRRELLRGGMRRDLADELTEQYRGIASLRRIFGANGVGIPFLR